MLKVGIIGCDGVLGSVLYDVLQKCYDVTGINSVNYSRYKGSIFDVLINANGNSKKYWANMNPLQDFEKSVVSVYRSLQDFETTKYVYISSLDAAMDNNYGFHKQISENIVKRHCKLFLILRCAAILSRNMSKGVIFDIINNSEKIFFNTNSRVQFITATEIAKIIKCLLEKEIYNHTFNIAGSGNIGLPELEEIFKIELKSRCISTEIEIFNEDVSEIVKYFKIKKSLEYITSIINERKGKNERMV